MKRSFALFMSLVLLKDKSVYKERFERLKGTRTKKESVSKEEGSRSVFFIFSFSEVISSSSS